MIITHTQNQAGYRRIYLGAKFSLECWIEPQADGRAWTFHYDIGAGLPPWSRPTCANGPNRC